MLGVAIDIGAMVSMFACVLACTTAAARVLMRMAHGGLLPARAGANRYRAIKHRLLPLHCRRRLMFAATAVLAIGGCTGAEMYDLSGSLAVFGFLTIYALVALALPFARKALGQHSHTVAAVSAFTVVVMMLIAVFDIRSRPMRCTRRIPLYLSRLYCRGSCVVRPAAQESRRPQFRPGYVRVGDRCPVAAG